MIGKNIPRTLLGRRHPYYLWAAHLPVNDSLVLREAEDSGSGVSFLRFWGNTAYLNKTKAHLVKSIHSLPMLVKSCSNSYWISELMAQDSHFLGRGRQSQRYTKLYRGLSRCGPRHAYVRIPWELVKRQIPGPISRLRDRSLGEGGRNGALRESVFNSALQVILVPTEVQEKSGFVIRDQD